MGQINCKLGMLRSSRSLVLHSEPFFRSLRLFSSSFVPRNFVVHHQLKPKEGTIPTATQVNWKEELASLTPEVKEELQKLRNGDPFKNSLTQLAKRFNLTRRTVGAVAKLNGENKEKITSADIYKMNPSDNWKGAIHYRKIRTMQKEREEYDRQRAKLQVQQKNIRNAKAKAKIV